LIKIADENLFKSELELLYIKMNLASSLNKHNTEEHKINETRDEIHTLGGDFLKKSNYDDWL